jgi:hypothetical protein
MSVYTIKTKDGLVPAKMKDGKWVEDKGVKFVYDGNEIKAVPVTEKKPSLKERIFKKK